MKTVRSLVVLYVGEEISTNTLQQIKYLIHNDFSANGQGITCVELSSDEIAQLVSEAAGKVVSNIAKQQQEKIQIKIKNRLPKFDKSIKVIANKFDITKKPNPLEIMSAYFADRDIRDAFITLSKAHYSDLSSYVINEEFLNCIKMVVKELLYVSRKICTKREVR